MQLGVPNIGGHLNTLILNNSQYRDIVCFVLNNNPGYSEIHVHRNGLRQAVMISRVVSGYGGGRNHLLHTDPLFTEAAQAASAH
ncbi:hypothetical protein [Pseudomonas cichorii]|uniref:hypothetical protein n=1 Tax=Pseudomonas cichorii TaxID=36746 RepID=UPI001C893F19|nr:hypothetical protein [Pseudomonas cichorii]MBX8486531.1 hypothetical protein [Pseudomonas cichorii]MBX8496653.1 hypothetical protein [Pseudomonas cichorii]MBX8529639.1 hypothetical protein [Pseudomonas cichorii]MBX8576106.1 hypothetical protein [Pseudomonas cichorii]